VTNTRTYYDTAVKGPIVQAPVGGNWQLSFSFYDRKTFYSTGPQGPVS